MPPQPKTDFKREIAAYSARSGVFSLVDVAPLQYLMADGHGDPNTARSWSAAIEAVYPLAYKLKFASKARGRDYSVMPLEALWWADDMAAFTSARDKSRWSWTLMNMVPDWITDDDLAEARAAVTTGAPVGQVRLERYREGLSVQTLHVGSYDDEAPVLRALHEGLPNGDCIPGERLRMTGRHHEIYLSDARRTAPERLRTILRQPVERIGEIREGAAQAR